MNVDFQIFLILLHSERPKLYGALAVLSVTWVKGHLENCNLHQVGSQPPQSIMAKYGLCFTEIKWVTISIIRFSLPLMGFESSVDPRQTRQDATSDQNLTLLHSEWPNFGLSECGRVNFGLSECSRFKLY